ncbi:MAG: isocitrate lyase/PEP mutase family protein [Ilumatobacteraceae bacterium]
MNAADPLRPGDRLRARLATPEPIVVPGVWDALTARLAVDAGFAGVFVSGFCVAASTLAMPDVGLVTQVEMADVARRVCAAVPGSLVVVDADTGYGNAVNVIRTVELWESAGAAGMFLEDQVWPKRCGHMSGKQVVDVDDWLGKLRAACDHREHIHVTARTDALAVNGLDDAIERAKMARDTGADAVFVEAPASVAELEAIASALPDVTLVANMVESGRTPLLTPGELADLGYRFVVAPVAAMFGAVHAMRRVFTILAEHGTLRDDLDHLVTFDDFTELVGLPVIAEIDARYRS